MGGSASIIGKIREGEGVYERKVIRYFKCEEPCVRQCPWYKEPEIVVDKYRDCANKTEIIMKYA